MARIVDKKKKNSSYAAHPIDVRAIQWPAPKACAHANAMDIACALATLKRKYMGGDSLQSLLTGNRLTELD